MSEGLSMVLGSGFTAAEQHALDTWTMEGQNLPDLYSHIFTSYILFRYQRLAEQQRVIYISPGVIDIDTFTRNEPFPSGL